MASSSNGSRIGNMVLMLALSNSETSYNALEWTLEHFFTPMGGGNRNQLVLIHAKRLASSVAKVSGPGATEIVPDVEAELRKVAMETVQNAKAICATHWVTPLVEVIEGNPKVVLMEAARRYNAEILIVGSHGYGAVQRFIRGSVSNYCVNNAECPVMVVKKRKS
ncbi:hypothetical protein LUZ63_007892 [Rhynchospora breviuscula]|uniref:UspA domain-containing protein n=1 Tax=Rhynchospora breviuscula TaxID=2022672 RepID=A0A9Q0CT56_9POAL|nr:hypothetical protein LUZ63_007892 [Rhynchospora breviuscula]